MNVLVVHIIFFWFPARPTPGTHINPLQVTVGDRGGHDGVVGVDDGHDVHPQQLVQGAVQVAALLLVVKIQIRDQNLHNKTQIKGLEWHFNPPLSAFCSKTNAGSSPVQCRCCTGWTWLHITPSDRSVLQLHTLWPPELEPTEEQIKGE